MVAAKIALAAVVMPIHTTSAISISSTRAALGPLLRRSEPAGGGVGRFAGL